MSRGVPVIATLNSAGPDIINHMVDGWIIEPGQVEALATQMKWCVANSDSLNDFGKAALIKADSWQWEDYRRELVLRVNEKISEFKE
jgi:glycosyltransferase involved in cell wall biosynthesis